ncbi:MAG: BACON domain-containing protein [Lachnospiraceae bacterium]|nr:BACON domain-containing protein [Lachnospiraceae bacterium]
MSKKNKLLQRFSIVLLLMLTLCFGFAPAAEAAAGQETTLASANVLEIVSRADAAAPRLEKTNLSFGSAATSTMVKVLDGTPTTVTTNASWISAVKSGTGVKVSVTSNASIYRRTGRVSVIVGTRTLTINVTQGGQIRVSLTPESGPISETYVLGAEATKPEKKLEKVLYIDCEAMSAISVSDDSSWMTTAISGKTIKITADPNYLLKDRIGYMTITNGYETKKIKVIQIEYAPGSYIYKKDWTTYISYYAWEQSMLHSTYLSKVVSAYNELKKLSVAGAKYNSNGTVSCTLSNAKQEELKKYVQTLVDMTCKAYALKNSATVVFFANDATYGYDKDGKKVLTSISCGAYNYQNNVVKINALLLQVDKELLAKTVFHEMRHKWQSEHAYIGKSLTEFLLYYNLYRNYISPETNFANYESQFVERDARMIGDKMLKLVK